MRIWFLPAIFILFALMSVLTLASIAPELAPRQLIFFVVSGLIFFFVSRMHFETIERLSPVGYAITIFLLVVTLIIGLQTRGASRWIDVGLFRLQPSQLAIPLVGLFTASLIKTRSLAKWSQLLLILVLIIIPAVLILVEPDLGTTLVYLASIGTAVYLSDIHPRQIFILLTSGLVIGAIAWMFVLQPYQKARIFSFVGSGEDSATQLTTAYNARQSLIAVGSGQLVGRGLGQGVQSHLRFLPERQTDFIFASLAEEFGFIGSMMIISLYFLIFLYLLYIGLQAEKKSAQLYCFIAAAMILLQTGINIGMNIGLLPITGLTLPLLSYGGSSLVSIAGMMGVIQAIAKNQKKRISLHLQ